MAAIGAVSNFGYAQPMRKARPSSPSPSRAKARPVPAPKVRRYPNRIHDLTKTAGLTYARVAEALGNGTHEVTISNLANGKQELTQSWMERLAKVFAVEPADILRASMPSGLLRVRVTGLLRAGHWHESFELPESDQFDVMIQADRPLREADLYAGVIDGQSMNRIYPDKTVVVLSGKLQRPGEIAVGKRYHVRQTRPDGSTEDTIKTLARSEDGRYWLKPESTEPEHQQWIPLDGGADATVELMGRVRFVVYRED